MRLVVNSHVAYARPLEVLFDSLRAARLDPIVLPVIVVIGGAASSRSAFGRLHGIPNVLQLWTTSSNYDYTALDVLFTHRNDPRVRARGYMYLHDTTTVTTGFTQAMRNYTFFDPLVMYMPAPPNSNICAFGSGVVSAIKDQFRLNGTMDKAAAIQLELGSSPKRVDWMLPVNGSRHGLVRPLASFGHVTWLPPRRCLNGTVDPYETGVRRNQFAYDSFGVIKYISVWGGSDGESGTLAPPPHQGSCAGPAQCVRACTGAPPPRRQNYTLFANG